MIRHKSGTQWSDDREVRWCHVRSASYTCRRREASVFQFSLKTSDDDLVIWVSKSSWQFHGLGLKTKVDGLVIWASKSLRQFLGFGLKTKWVKFVSLCLKTDESMKTVWGHASTSSGLLHREASRARVFQFCLKTGGGATVGGARGIIVDVAWKWSERWLVRWRWVQRGGSQSKLPLIICNFPFSPHRHYSLLVFAINRIIGLLWEASLSHLLYLRFSFC
jgi:hypothetical protein